MDIVNSHNSNSGNENRLALGMPLDLFLDRDENELVDHETAIRKGINEYHLKGGILLPDERNAGTGNIVIRGRPGSGKSILAMQLAQKCCTMNNKRFFSWFIAMEETPEHVYRKSKSFGWNNDYHCIRNLNELDDLTNPLEYGEILRRILNKQTGRQVCPIYTGEDPQNEDYLHNHKNTEPHVYVSRLSPRHLSPTDDRETDIFEERYRQLENLLSGAKSLRQEKPNLPRLAMVCIDSLNVFGDHLLTREQLYRLFDLFKRNHVIGVFVLEEDEGQVISPDSRLHGDVIEFLGDVIISLQYGEDAGYFVRYFEIVKSRYQHQIYGKHPFKIVTHKGDKDEEGSGKQPTTENPNIPVQIGIVIFPSLHYIVYGTERVDSK